MGSADCTISAALGRLCLGTVLCIPQIPEAKSPFWEQQSPAPPTALCLLTPQFLTRCIKHLHLILTVNEVEVVEALVWVP